MRTDNEILNDYAVGNHLDDTELIWLLMRYKEVARSTLVFGSRYALVFNDANLHEMRIRGYLESRGYGKMEEKQ